MEKRIISYTLLLSGMCLLGATVAAAPTSKGSKKMNNTAAAPKIAIVDVSRILTQDPQLLKEDGSISHEWRDAFNKHMEAMKKIEEEFNKMQTDYQTKMKELEALQKSGVSSPEVLQKKYKDEIEPLAYQLQTQPQQIQQFHMGEIRKIQSTVGQKIQQATDEVCKAQGWDFALSQDVVASIISSGSRFNITDAVLTTLNSAYSKSKAPAEKPAQS